ncbi:MAG: septum formation protein Maf [Deltaproteobacteria bacterium]|nr:septum formation protein Maf [Deltaproteobacteria bacterium]
MESSKQIVLASASPRRRKLLADAGIAFEVLPADVDETMLPGEMPDEYALRAAGEKGLSVAARLAREGRRPWILAADTVVVLDGLVLQKPVDDKEAREMLHRLSGRTHTVITGWTLGRHQTKWIARHDSTRVTFHELSDEEIAGYASTGEGRDKAGAYAIQQIGAFLVSRVEGDYFNVVGLPVSRVIRALTEIGAIERYPLE